MATGGTIGSTTDSASELNRLGIERATERQFQEAAACFRQAVAIDAGCPQFHNNLGNVLAELGDLEGARNCYLRVLALEPHAVDTHNNLGIVLSRLDDHEAAVIYYRRAVELTPNSAAAHCNLGVALARTKRHGDGVVELKRAIELKPDYPDAYNNLGMALTQMGDYDAALAAFEESLRLRPDNPDAHCNMAIALSEAARLDESLAHYQTALDIKPDYPDAHMNRAWTLLLRGDYEHGWSEYEWRFKNKANVRVQHDAPLWDGTPLAGRTLLLEAEQGMGDTIQFVRYAEEIKRHHDCRIIVACERQLLPLLKGVAGVDVLLSQNEPRPRFDVWASMMSVPGIMRHNLATFPARVPYLTADAGRVEKWKSRLATASGLKVGIAWQGNKANASDRRRSFPLELLAPVGTLDGLTLISLQKGDGSEQINALTEFEVTELGDDFDSSGGAFLDAAAVMQNLDLVITADTSIAHLAGALARPVWVALTHVPDWRWTMEGDRTTWYPTMRLFRQATIGVWEDVFQRMAEALLAEHPTLRKNKRRKTSRRQDSRPTPKPARLASPAEPLNSRGIELANQRNFREAADCFRQAIAADPEFTQVHNNLGNALVELGDIAGARDAYQRAAVLDPQSAFVQNNLGIALSRLDDHAQAAACFRKAAELAPDFAAAHNNLGIALARMRHNPQSVAAFRRAVKAQPDYTDAHNNLGMALTQMGEYEEALKAYDVTLRQKPNHAGAMGNKAFILLDLGRTAEAEQLLRAALALEPNDCELRNREAIFHFWTGQCERSVEILRQVLETNPQHVETHKHLGLILLLMSQYKEGFAEYEWRMRDKTNVRRDHTLPQWDGSPLAGRTLLLETEQGIGDTIQFIRYAAEIKRHHDCRIIVACDPPLFQFLEGVPGVDVLLKQNEKTRPPFDVWAPLLSIPGIMQHDLATFPGDVPYLKADPARVEKWKARLAEIKGLKIGIAWQGSRINIGDRRRSFPVKLLAPLAKLEGVTFISLQKGYGSEQLDALTDFNVVTLGDDFDSSGGAFLDTAAVMQNLDLVITADTSICHVAGALGVPTWLALAFVPDWRWTLHGERTPWYPTLRLFRQSSFGDWTSVFERMAQTLKAEHAELRPRLPADFRIATSGFNRLARTKHGFLLYPRNDAYTGKALNELGEVLEAELDVFRQLLRPGMTIVEVGANIGAHTVPLSRLVGADGAIHAIEPQRIVFQALCANVALNSLSNVHCHHVAAGERPGTILVPKLNYDQPNNFAGLSLGDFKEGESVPLVMIDSLNLPKCDFFKVQVAGMELPAVRGAVETIRKFRPLLYVENNRPEKSAALIEALLALDYKLFWHLPPYYSSANYYGNSQNPFGRLVSANMLGIHASLATNIQGMKPIMNPNSDWRKA